MFPLIDKKRTGIHLRRIMDERGLSVKDIKDYLGLSSVQSVYHWLNGISLPTIDNLYALSELFQMPMDDMLCGNMRIKRNYKNVWKNIKSEILQFRASFVARGYRKTGWAF